MRADVVSTSALCFGEKNKVCGVFRADMPVDIPVGDWHGLIMMWHSLPGEGICLSQLKS